MGIRDELALFDGRHTDVLVRILSERRSTISLIKDLVLQVVDTGLVEAYFRRARFSSNPSSDCQRLPSS